MKILIANDDGITAPGIRALVRAFADAGHEVTVVAPDGQRSAASHSMTLAHSITAREADVPGAVRAWAVSGTPVDCVKLGLRSLCPEAEFVVSGVNHGYNMGTDVLYSGTVGAAMEGALEGRGAVAVSLAYTRSDLYDRAAQAAVDAFDVLQKQPLPPLTILNVNYPDSDAPLGIKAVPLKHVTYTDTYVEREGETGERCFDLIGEMEELEPGDDDYTALHAGYVTWTALHFDMTAHGETRALAERIQANLAY